MSRKEIVSLDKAGFELWRSQDNRSLKRLPEGRILHRVVDEMLTCRQKEYVCEYYFEHNSIKTIAAEHGVAPSTVSRTLKRARGRIYNALKYSMMR